MKANTGWIRGTKIMKKEKTNETESNAEEVDLKERYKVEKFFPEFQ